MKEEKKIQEVGKKLNKVLELHLRKLVEDCNASLDSARVKTY